MEEVALKVLPEFRLIVPLSNRLLPTPCQLTVSPDRTVKVVDARIGPPILDPERFILTIAALETVIAQLDPPIANLPDMVKVPATDELGVTPEKAIVPAFAPVETVVSVS